MKQLQVAIAVLKGELEPHGVLTDEDLRPAGTIGYVADSIREAARLAHEEGTPPE